MGSLEVQTLVDFAAVAGKDYCPWTDWTKELGGRGWMLCLEKKDSYIAEEVEGQEVSRFVDVGPAGSQSELRNHLCYVEIVDSTLAYQQTAARDLCSEQEL